MNPLLDPNHWLWLAVGIVAGWDLALIQHLWRTRPRGRR